MRVKVLAFCCSVLLGTAALSLPGTASAAPAASGRQAHGATGLAAAVAHAAHGPKLNDVPMSPRARERAAEHALTNVQRLFARGRAFARGQSSARPTSQDATLLMRDLAMRVDDLSSSDRRTAQRYLARPSEGAGDPMTDGYQVPEATPDCSGHVCLHWVESSEDAPDLTDEDQDGTPDWVETTGEVMEHVWSTLVDDLGYRPPLSDLTSPDPGPNSDVDVYLAQLGDEGFYGYCVPEPVDDKGTYATGYCVLDNDFAEFAGGPLPSLQVTAAHEFFHAIQFGYDALEDTWLMEGSAAWVEDLVYDDADDNLQFLALSQAALPQVPLDYDGYHDPAAEHPEARGMPPYGAWLFWQYLTEHLHDWNDPGVVRRIWERADANPEFGGQDLYALQATLREVGGARKLRDIYAAFGAANLTPGTSYEEGRKYVTAKPDRRLTLTAKHRQRTRKVNLDHLTTSYQRIVPGGSLHGKHRLRIRVNTPPVRRGSAVTAVVHKHNGATKAFDVKLSRKGRGHLGVNFHPGKVRWVDLVVSNGSARFDCAWQGFVYSCGGTARDDGMTTGYSVKAVKR